MKYLHHLLGSNCARDVLPFFSSGSAKYKSRGSKVVKEICESMGCFHAAMDHLDNVGESLVFVVGDGIKPRTACLFAFYTKANVVSIDPQMRMDFIEKDLPEKFNVIPQRIKCYPDLASDHLFDCRQTPAIIVLPHSHCSMDEAIKMITNYSTLSIVNLPCCVQVQTKYIEPKFLAKCDGFWHYADPEILGTPKNILYVWKNIKP